MLVDFHWNLLQTTGSQPTTCNLCTSLAGLDVGRQTFWISMQELAVEKDACVSDTIT